MVQKLCLVAAIFLVEMVVSRNPMACNYSDPPCKATSESEYYIYHSAEGFNEVTKTIKTIHLSSNRILIKWNASTLYPGKWDHYQISWASDEGLTGCTLVPRTQTHLLVMPDKNGAWYKEGYLDVKVDLCPLPSNHLKFWPKKICYESGSENSTYDEGTSPQMNLTGFGSYTSGEPETDPVEGTDPAVTDPPGEQTTPIALGVGLAGVVVASGLLYVFIMRGKKAPQRPETKTLEMDGIREAKTSASATFPKRTYVSYWPENDDYVHQIASRVNWFREIAGYNVIMDKMFTTEISSAGPIRWAESEIQKADKVLVFLSPGYIGSYSNDKFATSDDQRKVWREIQTLDSIYSRAQSARKFVCILREDITDTQNLPPWAVLTYRWPDDKEKILMRLNDTPEFSKVEVSCKLEDVCACV